MYFLTSTFLCCVFLLLPFLAPAVAADCITQPLTAKMSEKVNTANMRFLMLEDPQAQWSIDDVATLPNSAFKQTTGSISSANKGGAVWLRLCLDRHSNAPQDWLLTILPAYTKKVSLYEPSADAYRVRHQGAVYPWDNREVAYRGFTYQLDLSESGRQQYTVRLEFFNRISADVMLLTADKMHELIALDYLFFGVYVGIALLVIFINLLLWGWFREPIYWRYALFTLLFCVFSSTIGGYLLRWLLPQSGQGLYPLMMVSAALFFASFHLLFQSVFNLQRYYKRCNFLSRLLCVSFCVFSLLFLLTKNVWLYRVYSYFYMLSMTVLMFVVLHDLLLKRRFAFYSLAFLPLLLALLISTLKASGLGGWIPFADYFPSVAALTHLVLINGVLVKRAWDAEAGRAQANQKILYQATEHNKNLELLVAARTEALQQTSEVLKIEVSSRKAAEVRLRELLLLEQSERIKKGELVTLVSHEFRSPLAVIDVAAQNLEHQVGSMGQAVLQRIQNIRNSVGRLNRLIVNFLAHDKLTVASEEALTFKRHELTGFLERVLSGYCYTNRLTFNAPGCEVYASIDENLVAIVVGNLVDNALKYSPPGAPITVRLNATNTEATIAVNDNGASIKRSARESIFHKYYRSDHSHARSGSGLGLFLARVIIEQHKGNLFLLPAPDNGVGNSFVVMLPL